MEIYISHKFRRLFGWLLFAVPGSLAFIAPIGVLSSGEEVWVAIPAVLIFLLWGVVLGGPILYLEPKLLLQPEGVWVKKFLKTQFYPWTAIKQAGVVSMYNKQKAFFYIVLLDYKDSKNEGDGAWFQIRNIGRLIYLPFNKAVLNYVTACYGLMDFGYNHKEEEKCFLVKEISE